MRAQARKFTFVNKKPNFCLGIKGYGNGTYNTLTVFDKAGISAKTTENYYIVKAAGKGGVAPAAEGFPLCWLILIILVIFAVLASTAYYIRKKERASAATNYFAIASL